MEKNIDYIESTVKENEIFSGKVVKLSVDDVVFPDGKKSKREVVHHNGGVCIVAVDDDGKILMERQYRYAMKKIIFELPAGKLEKNEDPKEAGIRELKEETGATAKTFEYLGKMYPTVGYDDEIIYFYLAKGLTFGENHFDEHEFVEVERHDVKELLSMIKNGEMKDAKSVFAITTYALKEGILKY